MAISDGLLIGTVMIMLCVSGLYATIVEVHSGESGTESEPA